MSNPQSKVSAKSFTVMLHVSNICNSYAVASIFGHIAAQMEIKMGMWILLAIGEMAIKMSDVGSRMSKK